jgi:ATP-dependent Clp protease ATP-binding subunit ClpB
VFNVLLQVLDDGRLTDGHGRTVDFRNVILIMTSNVGSELFLSLSDHEAITSMVGDELRRTFRPEFLNRVDATLLFHKLDQQAIRGIVDIQLARLDALLAPREISLQVSESAKDFLADKGYDPAYGARPLKRAITRWVLEPLSEKIIAGEISTGDRVGVGVDGQLLTMTPIEEAAA